jgi:hypothetical protein
LIDDKWNFPAFLAIRKFSRSVRRKIYWKRRSCFLKGFLRKENKKGCLCEKQPLYVIRFKLLFGKTLHQRRLQLRSLVGVYVVALGQLTHWRGFTSVPNVPVSF